MKNCQLCKKEIIKKYSESRRAFSERLFCSRECSNQEKKGRKLVCSGWNKGKEGYWKGKKFSASHCSQISESKTGKKLGERAFNWNGGKTLSPRGYVRVGNEKKFEHRIVMEKMIGRPLQKTEVVHHWNKIKIDNHPVNLCLFKKHSAHKRLHLFADRHGIEIKDLRFEQPWLYEVEE